MGNGRGGCNTLTFEDVCWNWKVRRWEKRRIERFTIQNLRGLVHEIF